jgi:hypothetical protein
MINLVRILLLFIATAYYVGCSPAKFEKDLTVNQCQNSGQTCVVTPDGREQFSINRTANGGLVDILFVTDNSASMSFEQRQMAAKFGSFISSLDSQSLDYRIGLITTDISNSNASSSRYNPYGPANGNGAFQDGKLITFSNGSQFITQSDSDRTNLFALAIERDETEDCEDWLTANPVPNTPAGQAQIQSSTYQAAYRQNCPSGDERGIYAANMFFNGQASTFVRQNAHLAIIFLADEDVSSSSYNTSATYKLDVNDLPTTLVSNLRQKYGSKSVSVHSIIVKPGSVSGTPESVVERIYEASRTGQYTTQVCGHTYCTALNPQATSFFSGGNSSCLSSQNNQVNAGYLNNVSASYGYMYSLLTKMMSGVEGDICAGDYSAQLGQIGSNIVDRVSDIQLACENPADLAVTISNSSIAWRVERNLLKFTPEVLPPGTRVTGQYSCPRL